MQDQKRSAVPSYFVPAAAHQPAPLTLGIPTKLPSVYHLIDPRLLYASPGQFTGTGLSGTLTLSELRYYQYQNQEIEAYIAIKLAQLPKRQQEHGTQHLVLGSQGVPQGYHQDDAINVPNSTFQQQHASRYARHLGLQQTAMPTQHPPRAPIFTAQMYETVQPTQNLLPQPGYLQSPGSPFHPPIQNIQQHPVPIESRPMPAQPGSTSTRRDMISPGLPAFTRPAGIAKSTFKTLTPAGLPDFSDPAQRVTAMAAFKKLSREEKIAKLLELERAEKAMNPNAITQVQKILIKSAAEQAAAAKAVAAGEYRMDKSKRNAENMIKPSYQQAIIVPAPIYRTRQSAYTNTPGVGGFASHPEYSSITSSFRSPQSHRVFMVPTLAPKRKEK
ncbi:uncharacterized protein ALTATR162_LOCUS6076 [Alternaria atra]|uniref:Uncharacterized protein n=1 Tax=Alternaria atra TaxID=119953 RepID=A0A8J2N282_9PLEO|nr:uncharacterized protein ALTATR162_LOCUS6076 [Alternaria atra]CAG5161697.1 unnamed protein product [Alternaria atra]